MKDELVNNIVCMLDSMDVDTDGIADRLYILLRNYEIKPLETQLAIRDDSINEHLLKRFLAAKMVKGFAIFLQICVLSLIILKIIRENG